MAYISHPGGRYMLGLQQVEPGETVAIDIRKLRDAQTPDEYGNPLPLDLAAGQTNWRWHDGAPLIGRTNVMSVAAGIAQNMSCETCACNQIEPRIEFLPFHTVTLLVGEFYQSTEIREHDAGCDSLSPYYFQTQPSYLTWTSDNPAVASVDGNGLIAALSPGTALIRGSAQFQVESWEFQYFTADGEPIGECVPQPSAEVVDQIGVTVVPQVTTDDVVVIAWVNSAAIGLPSGANQQLVDNLNAPLFCSAEVADWLIGIPTDLTSDADRAYANAFLVKFSGNAEPFPGIDPNAVLAAGDFRLFNRLKVKFSASTGTISNLTILESKSIVGKTPDPCGLAPALSGEAHASNGAKGITPSAAAVYQLTEGRIGGAGQLVFLTINGTSTPWIWSVIRFDPAGNLTFSDRAIFPTYYVYKNGELVGGFLQSAVSTFASNDASYQRLPSQIQ